MSRKSAGNTSDELAAQGLSEHWNRLHLTDREPWPDERRIASLARHNPAFAQAVDDSGGPLTLARQLQEAWRAFHAGNFAAAIKLGSALGAMGATAANRAAAVQSLYSKLSDAQLLKSLKDAAERGEQAVKQLPEYPNAHYMLALVLGRYSQRISILKALSEGLAGRVRGHLEKTLDLEPRHAEAHVALGLFHAEIINKLGALAAGLTYNVSGKKAIEHFNHASRLAPASAIVCMEHAHGLLLLDADRYAGEADSLFERAAACKPLDAMERSDVEAAKRSLSKANRAT